MAVSDELVRAGWTIAITLVGIFAIIIAVGFRLLYRRSKRAPKATSTPPLQHANVLLVRLDDAVSGGENELNFAIAQFGVDVTAAYASALAMARTKLTEAFKLKQQLDDAVPDSETKRRDWTDRIIHLCESAQNELSAEAARFDDLRQLDKNAPANLEAIRAEILSVATRRSVVSKTLAKLSETYAPGAVESVADNLQRADAALAAAEASASDADAAIGATSTTAAVDAIRSATENVRQAGGLFDAIATLATELGRATDAAATLEKSTRAAIATASSTRDNPPDPEIGAAVGAAIVTAEGTLANLDLSDPIAALDQLRSANATLDTSLAGARNQQQRLDGARVALTGALVSARSQLAVTHDFIASRRGSVGADARTRLAEAERLLVIAEAEADPVLALDTARSSATYSRDADALARYAAR